MFRNLAGLITSDLADVVRSGRIRGRNLDAYVDKVRDNLRKVQRDHAEIARMADSEGWAKLCEVVIHPRLKAIAASGKRLAFEDPQKFVMEHIEERIWSVILDTVGGHKREHADARDKLAKIESYEFEQQKRRDV